MRCHDNPKPDENQALVSLGKAFEAAWAEEEACREAALPENIDTSWEPWDRAYERTSAIVQEILVEPAYTLEGIRIKARAVQWCYGSDTVDLGYQTTDNRLATQIVNDLLAMEVPDA